MQRILTREREVGQAPEARAPFEISLVILQITGLDDMPMVGGGVDHFMAGTDLIVLSLDDEDDSCERFMVTPPVRLGDEALTREVEALLIHRFKPSYNEILFDNYPNIAGGMRSHGYSWTELILEALPAVLYTDHYSMEPPFDEATEQDESGGTVP